MPRRPEQNAQLRAESRTRIINAAVACFAQTGYSATSIKQIAQTAGIAQGLLYRYFANKEALLVAIFEQSVADVLRSFAEAEAEGAPSERVERLIRASFQILREQRAFWQIATSVRSQPDVTATLAPYLVAWTEAITKRLEGYLAAAGHPQPAIEAALLFAMIDGVGQHYLLAPDVYPLAPVIEALVVHYRAADPANVQFVGSHNQSAG